MITNDGTDGRLKGNSYNKFQVTRRSVLNKSS